MSAAEEATYCRPETVTEARELLAEYGADAKLTAGGQSLSLLLRQGLLNPAAIVDLSGVEGLDDVDDGDPVTIGATATYTAVENHPVSDDVAALRDAVEVIADPQVRNLGTLGGAVSHADPSLDAVPVLLALDATMLVGSTEGAREVALDEFAQGYMTTDLGKDELVEGVRFERPPEGYGTAYEKHSNVEGGWATVGVAAVLGVDDGVVSKARVALAAVAETAVRAPSVESALVGSEPTDGAIAEAAREVGADIDPLDDLSGSVRYKESLAETLTKRSLQTARERTEDAR